MNIRAEYFQNLFSKTFHGQRNEKWKKYVQKWTKTS